MTQLLPIIYDNIDTLAASALAKSRDCITAIREDVLHNVKPLERVGFERLMSAMERRQIFTQDILVELDVQMDCITHLIDRGTTLHERIVLARGAPNAAGPGPWSCFRRPVRSPRDFVDCARPDARRNSPVRAASGALIIRHAGFDTPRQGAPTTLLLLQMSAARKQERPHRSSLCGRKRPTVIGHRVSSCCWCWMSTTEREANDPHKSDRPDS